MKSLVLKAIMVLAMFSCQLSEDTGKQNQAVKITHPKNIILMIGDGMGISQISAGMISNNWHLELERCSDFGFIKTYSANQMITESAAGATAFATGQKTYNGAISVDVDSNDLVTIFEILQDKGYLTGLAVTSSVVHATPAAFYAHEDYRRKYDNIAQDLVNSKVNVFAGGGTDFFTKREDGRNLVEVLESEGFILAEKPSDLNKNLDARTGYLGAPDGMPRSLDGRGDFLKESTESILDRFKQINKPFMLMIEGSQIDWGGHANDAEYIRTEMLDFNNCIKSVLDFAEKDGETLVIITADHETGGFSITGGTPDSLTYAFTSDEHTPVLIPVFAFGPGSEAFSGIYENTGIFDRIKKAALN